MAKLAVQGSIVAALAAPVDDAQAALYASQPFDVNEVTKGLFISDIAAVFQPDALEARGITHILSLVPVATARFPEKFSYKSMPVFDVMDEDMIAVFDDAFDFIDRARAANGAVLVHCMSGVSRSGTVVIAYLMRKFGFSLRVALEMAQTARPAVRPNPSFMFQLQLYEDMGCKVHGNSKAHRTYRSRVRRVSPRTSPETSLNEPAAAPASSASSSSSSSSANSVVVAPCSATVCALAGFTLRPVPSTAYNPGRGMCVAQ